MNPLYDLEVIDSAVLSGEIDDAMKLIQKKIKSLKNAENISKNERIRSHSLEEPLLSTISDCSLHLS